MKHRSFLLGATILVMIATDAWAQQVLSFTPTPGSLEQNASTVVTFTIVTDSPPNLPSATLQRLGLDNKWKPFDPLFKLVPVSGQPNTFKANETFQESGTGSFQVRLSITFQTNTKQQINSSPATIFVSKTSPAGPITPLTGQGGLMIKGGSIGARSIGVGVGIAASSSVPPLSDLPREAVLDVLCEEITTDPTKPRDPTGTPLVVPFILQFPTSAVDGTRFFFLQQTLADSPFGGLVSAVHVVETGTAMGGQITTDNNFLQGLFCQGRRIVEVAKPPGTGFVAGKITDSAGAPRPGVRVRNICNSSDSCLTTNAVSKAFFTDSGGNYVVPVDATKYQVEAIDGFRCSMGQQASTHSLPSGGAPGTIKYVTDTGNNLPNGTSTTKDATLDITLNQAGPLTRDGLRNGSLEAGNLACWTLAAGSTATAVNAVANLPSASAQHKDMFGLGSTIQPSEGLWYMALSGTTGIPTVTQSFILPPRTINIVSGVSTPEPQKLRFDFTFGCPSTIASCPGSNATTANTVGVEAKLCVSNCTTGIVLGTFTQGFANFGGALAWRSGEIPYTATAPTTLQLQFKCTGVQNSSACLIDNVRLDTVNLFVNIVGDFVPSTGTRVDQIRTQVRDANEILSQAGITLRIRQIIDWNSNPPTAAQIAACGGGFTLNDLKSLNVVAQSATVPFARSNEMKQVTCLGAGMGVQDSDVLIYYANDLDNGTSTHPYGIAITREDWQGNGGETGTQIPRQTLGILFNNLNPVTLPDRARETWAHELGHLLMPLTVATEPREHGEVPSIVTTNVTCTPSNFTLTGTSFSTFCSARPLFIADQTQTVEGWDPPNPPPPQCPLHCPK